MLSRREFLKLSTLSLGGAFIPPWLRLPRQDFPQGEHLGRVIAGGLKLYSQPRPDSQVGRTLFEDEIIVSLRTVVGSQPFRQNQTWVGNTRGLYMVARHTPCAQSAESA